MTIADERQQWGILTEAIYFTRSIDVACINSIPFEKKDSFAKQQKTALVQMKAIINDKLTLRMPWQSIYDAKGRIGDIISKGDKFYLDNAHKNHPEVFNVNRIFKAALNLDGSINRDKTAKRIAKKKRLPR